MKIIFLLLLAGAAILLFYTVMKARKDPVSDPSRLDTEEVEYREQYDHHFTLSYRGYRMIGKKYLHPREDSIEVTKVVMNAVHPDQLSGFSRNDLYKMEECILSHFPYASIEWKQPVKELVLTEI
ncbi:hypothetical protein SAMN05421663_11075 [Terribacillus halophilus]|uniref:Sigma-w pathway protein ysdB n=1 Tax=Terribacillus halophilus TaxID=361279 RepID=A0A1G6UH27_9BACI|nr:hypothetical protein [Terribacillus halophilus]SDD40591.1 hypothetical protein SAMN05421663_11075 [Terribacillus halophilus]